MTVDIENMKNHMITNHKDYVTKRRLQMLLAKRGRMIIYLKKHDFGMFRNAVNVLGLEEELKQTKIL